MKTRFALSILLCLSLFIFFSCTEKNTCTDPTAINFDGKGDCVYAADLTFKFKVDANQQRLDNFGQPATLPAGHAAQTPVFNTMGIHYIELSKENDIPAYSGVQVYKSPTTTEGGREAIDFDEALYAQDGDEFFTINLSEIPPGTYKYLRMSLSYQNYTIDFTANGFDLKGTIASFVGANSYIRNYTINQETVTVNANKAQGYWAFETDFTGVPVIEGQAPAGATTVPNPIAATSAIPPGSCLVTGVFDPPIVITGLETQSGTIVTSVSINNSFEWKDPDGNGRYNPTDGDMAVDMGVRGLVPSVE